MVVSILPFLFSLSSCFLLLFHPAYALQLNSPTQKGSTIIFDDTEPTTVTWTTISGDPSQFDIKLENDDLGMSPQLLEYQLQTNWLTYDTYIPEVKANPNYYIACIYYESGKEQSCGRTDLFAIYKKGTTVTTTKSTTTTSPPTTSTHVTSSTQPTTSSPATTATTATSASHNLASLISSGAASATSTSHTSGVATVTTTSNGTVIVFTSFPTATPTSNTGSSESSSDSTPKSSHTGAIVGGVVGGVVILLLIAVLIWLLRRRRSQQDTDYTAMKAQAPFTAELGQSDAAEVSQDGRTPVLASFRQGSGPPPSEKRRELDRIVQEREEALQRRERLQDGLSSVATNASTTDSGQAELHEKIAQLTARIFELETQQRETEYYLRRSSHAAPPPDYGAST